MGKTLSQKISEFPAGDRAEIEARAAQLIAEEMSLQDLRKVMSCTQTQIAHILNVGQDTISRYEQRNDMLLSTVRNYVRALGGELELLVRLPNRAPVILKAFGESNNSLAAVLHNAPDVLVHTIVGERPKVSKSPDIFKAMYYRSTGSTACVAGANFNVSDDDLVDENSPTETGVAGAGHFHAYNL